MPRWLNGRGSPSCLSTTKGKPRALSNSTRNQFRFNFRKTTTTMTSVSQHLEVGEWTMKMAPLPKNIRYRTLNNNIPRASICSCMIHIIIFSILVFATTPSAIYDAFRDWSEKDWSGIYASLFLTTINLLIPVLVNLPDYLCSCCIPYETKSSTHLWKFQRNLLYMTVTSVIMPMVGINSVVNMMHGRFNSSCILNTDNLAFVSNFVMTAAIIGNLTELIRPLHLLKYCWWSIWKSSVETLSLRKSIQTEFDYGENLSRILVMTTLSGMYSVTNPIISLFGLIYIGIKYYVDRHNLLLAYKASHLNTAVFTWACYGSRCYVRLAFLRQFKTD
jgi:hypothetical protein